MVTVALIHDGFGVALKRLAEQRSKLPDGALHALTAAGDAFEWNTSDDDLFRPEFNGTKPCLVVNLRWKGAKFRQKRGFAGCNSSAVTFGGALFKRCIFDGVSFVNCLLDGMMLSECEIRGKASKPPDTYSDGAAQFRIADSSHIVGMFQRYRPDVSGDRKPVSGSSRVSSYSEKCGGIG